MKQQHFVTKAAALTLALAALAEPALAATINLGACGVISKPGSYRLTKDLSINGNCSKITASGVTLDLGGHTLIGNAGTGPLGFAVLDAGVAGTSRQIKIKVRNGTIKGFITAVELRNSHGALVEKLDVRGNATGIKAGPGAFILSNHVASSSGSGIFAQAGSVIEGNTVVDNALSDRGDRGRARQPDPQEHRGWKPRGRDPAERDGSELREAEHRGG